MTEREREIEAREKAASPGPWQTSGAKNDILTADLDIIACFCDREDDYEADADFIAHAREDIPYLLAQLIEARAEDAPLRAALKRLEQTMREQLESLIDSGVVDASKTKAAFDQAHAALSSDAGKGWVSPDRLAEVRAHAPDGAPTGGFYGGWVAALDALKGVE